MKKTIVNFLFKIVNKVPLLFIPIYWSTYLMPRDKKIWVFGSSFGKSFLGNPKYMYLYMNEIESEIRPIWISKDKEIVSNLKKLGFEAYEKKSLKGIVYSLRAKVYIFDHYSKDINFWLSAGAFKVNLWHGIPLKKGHRDNKFDKVRNPVTIEDKVRWIFRRMENEKPSHYYSVTSEFIKKLHTRAFNAISEHVFICGYSRNDIFLSNDYLNNKEEIIVNDLDFFSKIVSLKEIGYRCIVYMPTFRESENLFFDVVNLEKLNIYLDDNKLVLLVKAHHLSKLTHKFNTIDYSNIKNIKDTDDPYPYLKIADSLITDYSSVYFDFLLLDRPIIFFPYDLDIYMNESRELYYDYDTITPGPKSVTMEELENEIKRFINGEDSYKDDRKRVLDLMFDYKDGKSSERLYNKLIDLLNINK